MTKRPEDAELGEVLGNSYSPPGRPDANFDIPSYDDIADLTVLFKRFANTAASVNEAGGGAGLGELTNKTGDFDIDQSTIDGSYLCLSENQITVNLGDPTAFKEGAHVYVVQGSTGTVKLSGPTARGMTETEAQYQGIQAVIHDGSWWCLPAGPQGEPGIGLHIEGSYASYDEFIAAHPTGEPGDAWIVAGDLYVWNSWDQNPRWVDEGVIQGPPGPQGKQGPQGVAGPEGPQGIQGPQGVGVHIEGSYPDYETFIAAHPTGEPGEAWIVAGKLYMWDDWDENPHWIDDGMIQGPQGQQGIQGPRGFQGDQGPVGPSGVASATSPLVYNTSAKNISVNLDELADDLLNRAGIRKITISSKGPSGGSNGDVWFRY